MTKLSYVDAINRALHEEMERDPRVVSIGLDIGRQGGLYGATRGLYDRFGPDRVIDAPISEAGYTGAAIGMARQRWRPVVEMQIADFVTVAFDQLATVAAKTFFMSGGTSSAPLVVRLPYGASIGGSGYMSGAGPNHSQSPEAWFCHCPGLKVVMPSTPADALGLLKSAVRDDDPVIFLEHKGMYSTTYGETPAGEHLVPIGSADIKRAGADVTIIATGATVGQALAVATRLAEEGIDAEVLDPRTMVPLDRFAVVSSATKTGRVVIVHEAARTAGFGAELAAVVAEDAFPALCAPIVRVCGRDMPIPAGIRAVGALPSESRIESAVRAVMSWPKLTPAESVRVRE